MLHFLNLSKLLNTSAALRYSERCLNQQNLVSCETTIRKPDNTYINRMKELIKLRTFDVITDWVVASEMRLITDTFQGIIHLYVNIVRQLLSLYWILYFLLLGWSKLWLHSENDEVEDAAGGLTRMIDGSVRWSMVFVGDMHFSLTQTQDSKSQTYTYSASHQKPLRLNPSQQTDVENTSLQSINYTKNPHWDVFHRLDSGEVTLPQIRKNTHTLNVADLVLI